MISRYTTRVAPPRTERQARSAMRSVSPGFRLSGRARAWCCWFAACTALAELGCGSRQTTPREEPLLERPLEACQRACASFAGPETPDNEPGPTSSLARRESPRCQTEARTAKASAAGARRRYPGTVGSSNGALCAQPAMEPGRRVAAVLYQSRYEVMCTRKNRNGNGACAASPARRCEAVAPRKSKAKPA